MPPHSLALCIMEKMKKEIQWGLMACGRVGDTSIDIDESISGPEIYEIEISKSRWSLRFRIDAPGIANELLTFLENTKDSILQLGQFNDNEVQIFRDDEFSDRFFIVIDGSSGRLNYTIAGKAEIDELIIALQQLIEDLR